jgi:hypothetical protein
MLFALEIAWERWRYRNHYPSPELQEVRSLIEFIGMYGRDIHHPLPPGYDRRPEAATMRSFASQLVEACDLYAASLDTAELHTDRV